MKLEVGDLVRLKSGGPRMVVSKVFDNLANTARCQWFDGGGHIQDDSFYVDTLIVVEEKKSSERP